MTELQVQLTHVFGALVKAGAFNPIRRHLMRHPDAEDRLAEAVALTWVAALSYTLQKQRLPDAALLVHVCRLRAIDLGRRLVGCGNRDVLSLVAHRLGRVEVLTIDVALENGLAREHVVNPSKMIISALDLAAWLEQLDERDQQMMAGRMAGERLAAIAATLGTSPPTVCRRSHELGLALADRAGVKIDLGRRARGRPRRLPS